MIVRRNSARKKIRGWVYVLTNKAMPGIVKVGFSLKDPELRAAELGNTSVPHPFVVEYEMLVHGPENVERLVHSKLRGKHDGKEFFRCALSETIAMIRLVAGDAMIQENVRTQDQQSQSSLPHLDPARETLETTETTNAAPGVLDMSWSWAVKRRPGNSSVGEPRGLPISSTKRFSGSCAHCGLPFQSHWCAMRRGRNAPTVSCETRPDVSA